MAYRSLRLTLGGVVDPDDLIGRDALVAEVESHLTRGDNVLLTGERRVGKTSALSRLRRDLAKDWTIVAITAEGHRSIDELVTELAEQIQSLQGSVRTRVADLRERWHVSKVGPISFDRASVSPHRAMEELVATVKAEVPRLLLIIDELPILALTLARTEPEAAAALLHRLRALRLEHPDVGMVLAGSIGFHHVTRLASGSVNDLVVVRADPLLPEPAAYLAGCLLTGEAVPCDDIDAVATAAGAAAEGVPYFVQHIVADLARQAEMTAPVTAHEVAHIVERAIADPDDPWGFDHYPDRLPRYYPGRVELAGAVLDAVSVRVDGLTLEELLRVVSADPSQATPARREDVVGMLADLARDHYLDTVDLRDRFSLDIVRRAWRRRRRLDG